MLKTVLPTFACAGASFAIFGVDGSRIELPRTKSHEEAQASRGRSKKRKHRRGKKSRAAVHAKKESTPQMWLTMLWHAGTGIPWAWRIGPGDSSEREHFRDMIPELPDKAMVVGDAGYAGYEYARTLPESGRHLLLRVGSNVRLLRKLGMSREADDTVYLWPQYAQPAYPPLKLRLIVSHNGKHPIYLVTSVLSSRRLSERQIIDIDRRRWGIEVFFRHLKQTYQRRKLHSKTTENARVELEWSLIGLWGMVLYAQAEIQRHDGDTTRLSVACALRSYRRMMRDYRHPAPCRNALCSRLRCDLRDEFKRRNKSSRNRPCKKRVDPPPRSPILAPAGPTERLHARVYYKVVKKGVTA